MEVKIIRERKINELGASSEIPKSAFLAAVDSMCESTMPSERQSVEWSILAMKGQLKY